MTRSVPREQAGVGIDPWHKVIDRQGDDNVGGWKRPGRIPSEPVHERLTRWT